MFIRESEVVTEVVSLFPKKLLPEHPESEVVSLPFSSESQGTN